MSELWKKDLSALLLVTTAVTMSTVAGMEQQSTATTKDAVVCLNGTEYTCFNCSTNGQAMELRINGTAIHHYQDHIKEHITFKTKNKLPGPGVDAELCISGLNMFTNTRFECVNAALNDESEFSLYLRVQGPPSPPSNLAATLLNETSIKLTWSVPPGVLDEELISYLVEVRNESGGLIVFNETDGTEYIFAMENPNPCVLYNFTVIPLCGMKGGSAEVTGTFFDVPEKVNIRDFEIIVGTSDSVVMKNYVQENVCYLYAVDVSRSETLFSEHQGDYSYLLIPEENYSIYYLFACNAAGCSSQSEPITTKYEGSFNSTSSLSSVLMIAGENNIHATCTFTQGSLLSACLFIFTEDDDSLYFLRAERNGSTAVGYVDLPHGSYSWSVFGVESTGLPEHNAAITDMLLVEGNRRTKTPACKLNQSNSENRLYWKECSLCISDIDVSVLIMIFSVRDMEQNTAIILTEGQCQHFSNISFNAYDVLLIFNITDLEGNVLFCGHIPPWPFPKDSSTGSSLIAGVIPAVVLMVGAVLCAVAAV